MKISNESYIWDEYFNNLLECNRLNSFTNTLSKYVPCHTTYDKKNFILKFTNRITSALQTDAVRHSFMNGFYALFAAYNEYAITNCSNRMTSADLANCLLDGYKKRKIRSILLNITLNVDSQNNRNVKVFNENTSNGFYETFTIYHIKGEFSAPNYIK